MEMLNPFIANAVMEEVVKAYPDRWVMKESTEL
jgi:hypothetical protein